MYRRASTPTSLPACGLRQHLSKIYIEYETLMRAMMPRVQQVFVTEARQIGSLLQLVTAR
jgi:hypothetical protein